MDLLNGSFIALGSIATIVWIAIGILAWRKTSAREADYKRQVEKIRQMDGRK